MWCGKSVDFEESAANLFSCTFYHIRNYSTTVSYKTATTTYMAGKNLKNRMHIYAFSCGARPPEGHVLGYARMGNTRIYP